MRNLDENTITRAVLERHGAAANPRLAEIMTSLVTHLHAFAREVNLTEQEWFEGIRFLNDCGHISDDKRQEFILLSDTLGLSMLVTALNHRKPAGCTEATVFGPFHVEDAPRYPLGRDLAGGTNGPPCFVQGQVRGRAGEPIAGAELDIWHSDEEGLYDVQYGPDAPLRGRGVLRADADGRFHFRTSLPRAYPVPHDGPVGALLRGLGRHAWRPAHIHFMITAPGYERLITHVFREGDEYLESDAVFGVRSSLIARWELHDGGTAPDGTPASGPFYTLDFDFVLNPEES